MRYVRVGPEAASEAGNKAASLALLADCGQQVPAWFAVHPRGFFHSLDAQQRRQLVRLAKKFRSGAFSTLDKNAVQSLLNSIELLAEVRNEISKTLATQPGTHFAVRSSAAEEDGASHSFAGQFETFLCVPKSQVVDRVIEVWKSGFSERVLSYKEQAGGVPLVPSAPAVIIQQMIEADVSGVAFSADPISGNQDRCLIEAVPGLGEGLVSGALDADRWVIDRSGKIVERHIAEKLAKMIRDPRTGNGTRLCRIEHNQLTASLSDSQIETISKATRVIAKKKECHQDIEWCIANGQLYLLQARPITTITPTPAYAPIESLPETVTTEGEGLLCFDNSNIQESYPGITTPLTFSFARKAYENVYRQFLKIMGVGRKEVEAHATVFPRMLALVQGRMYYNLASWFELLALLPGFGANRSHMETMMGLKESVPDSIRTPAYRVGKFGLVFTGASMILNFILLKHTARRFERRVDESLSVPADDLAAMNLTELANHYRTLEQQLLTKWDAPLINDFFAMIFYGVLSKLCRSWLPSKEYSMENLLVADTGGIISAEPAIRIVEMARVAARSDQFVVCLCVADQHTIEQAIEQNREFKCLYKEYLDKFADRCLEELKLETATLADDSLLLLRSIGQVARHELSRTKHARGAGTLPTAECQSVDNSAALTEAMSSLSMLKQPIFQWVLANARDLIRRRENLRFVRTQIFGRVRRIFVELGKRLATMGILQNERDIFYLEVEEVLGFLEGGSSCHDLAGIAATRKSQFAGWAELPEPPGRILTTTSDWVSQKCLQNTQAERQSAEADSSSAIKGTACSPGKVRGRVRVVTDPREAKIQAGEILVAKRTDPGWVMLFPVASGLIVENGSLLSHSAIVSRELGLPSIVGVKNATSILKNGDLIEMDGSTGKITVLSDDLSNRLAAS